MVNCLPNMHDTLGSTSSTEKTKRFKLYSLIIFTFSIIPLHSEIVKACFPQVMDDLIHLAEWKQEKRYLQIFFENSLYKNKIWVYWYQTWLREVWGIQVQRVSCGWIIHTAMKLPCFAFWVWVIAHQPGDSSRSIIFLSSFVWSSMQATKPVRHLKELNELIYVTFLKRWWCTLYPAY